MSFFSKAADQDTWKEKYLNLLDEQEQSEKSYKEKEDLLCKMIVRLTIATTGLDPLMDPYLLSIRDQLKNGINSPALKDELEKLTNFLAQIKHAPPPNQAVGAESLFDFLLQHYTTEKQQNALNLLKNKVANHMDVGAATHGAVTETLNFEIPPQLFIAILQAIEPDDNTSASNIAASQIEMETVSRQLLLFLEGIEIPGIFEQQAQTVKQLLTAPNQIITAFETILEKTFQLLIKIKQHNHSERRDIDKFHCHITEQLAALKASMVGAGTINSAEHKSRFDQISPTDTTELLPLKEVINCQLATIVKEAQEHQQNEAIQRKKTQQQLDDLVIKLDGLETESCDLKSKLNELEQSENNYKDKEDLLCKTIIHLTIATTGLDPLLDPHLLGIRDQLKNGINSSALKDELEKFTASVAQIEHATSQNRSVETELLFNFLLQRYTNEKQQYALKLLKEKKFDNANQLFIALLQAIEPDNNTSASAILANHIDIQIVSKQLLLLLEGIEIPSAFDQQAQTVKQLLSVPNQTITAFETILDKSFQLLLKIKQHNQSEQQDIDKFLSHITDQLAALDVSVMGASVAAQQSAENRSKLDQSVSEQMEELQLSSSNATRLKPLKGIINSRLANITKEIQDHNQKESIQRQKTQQQLNDLVDKIKDMESESCDLKSKLKIANTLALRDTLTGLPNRNAYNQRLEAELARWKRYHSPLSLIIWDLDHFKNINDSYGHKAGDKVLLLIAKQLSDHSRASDFISRFGGEEFTMLLPNTDGKSALILANQLRQTIGKTGFNAKGAPVAITISCGVTEFKMDDTDETAFERADQALYLAKEQGRNRCCIL